MGRAVQRTWASSRLRAAQDGSGGWAGPARLGRPRVRGHAGRHDARTLAPTVKESGPLGGLRAGWQGHRVSRAKPSRGLRPHACQPRRAPQLLFLGHSLLLAHALGWREYWPRLARLCVVRVQLARQAGGRAAEIGDKAGIGREAQAAEALCAGPRNGREVLEADCAVEPLRPEQLLWRESRDGGPAAATHPPGAAGCDRRQEGRAAAEQLQQREASESHRSHSEQHRRTSYCYADLDGERRRSETSETGETRTAARLQRSGAGFVCTGNSSHSEKQLGRG